MSDEDKQFARMVAYFWCEKEDPTRYVDWNEERCRKLMPDFYVAWHQATAYRSLAFLAAKQYAEE